MDKIKSGCESIDSLLNGGFERGCITELYGEAGSGKTNICLSTAINVAKEGHYVIYIDTEGISMERFSQLGGNEDIAKRILFYKVYKFSQQAEIIERAINLVEKRNDIILLIVDSMTEFYRAERGVEEDLSAKKRSSLAWQLSILNSIARKKNIAVIITNQVYMDTTTKELRPIGGHTLHHNAKTIIFLRKIGNGYREALLIKHRSLPEGIKARFIIGSDGLYPEEKE
ncbi:DNA repair and recombination protein RadB [Candidatus Aciduliprofundum boonei]|uniref:DNA repair and recombination protein RadB n=1 Tax=Aciduliprofundum boonei (strain DSM 19572 / T469) TaxID=439481 RepID=D3TCL7_ACIB4|nr:DNA repair and recombination protein RadB [Candidatus Aciduliprofundum boonei]ADD08302.1 DNA repair and recombination protein RadB [Aciduliprofundum boonei T469]